MALLAGFQLPISGRAGIELAMSILTLENQVWLRALKAAGKDIPSLYRSAVVYGHDRVGEESWLTIPVAKARGRGDCKVLASWRVAELRESGVDPQATWEVVSIPLPRGQGRLWHVIVRRGDGRKEDPSKDLGMEGVA